MRVTMETETPQRCQVSPVPLPDLLGLSPGAPMGATPTLRVRIAPWVPLGWDGGGQVSGTPLTNPYWGLQDPPPRQSVNRAAPVVPPARAAAPPGAL